MEYPRDVKPGTRTGGQWKASKLTKGLRKSQTPGNKKGLVPPSIARYIARSNRSYKHADYSWWNTKCDGNKIQWTGKKG